MYTFCVLSWRTFSGDPWISPGPRSYLKQSLECAKFLMLTT